MIAHLSSPSVCVIDDEKKDYEPIQKALSTLRVASVHVKGNCKSNIPRRPFHGLRVVFTDLYLNASVGKPAASHTAKVFASVVPENTGPVVVVIWSKHKEDIPGDDNITEAQLFKDTLLAAYPAYLERLVFLEMEKPKLPDRPSTAKWVRELVANIKTALSQVSAFDAMLAWESLVRDAAIQVTNGITALSQPAIPQPAPVPAPAAPKLTENLQLALRLLVREQGGPACSAKFAPKHLTSALGQCLIDQLEHMPEQKRLASHGTWLSDLKDLPKANAIAPSINGFLLTSETGDHAIQFKPGTVYQLRRASKFKDLFGISHENLLSGCYSGKEDKFAEWKAANTPVPIFIELSPVCDAHNEGKRHSAFLLGGLIFPAAARAKIKGADSTAILPTFMLRWKGRGFPSQAAFVVCFSRLKITLSSSREPRWLIPWFRIRELPAASLRNWHSSQAARVGYVSL